MSAEWVTAAGTIGTFVVIAASAIAALVQLHHMRAGNQFAVLNGVRDRMEEPWFKEAVRFIRYELPLRLDDPAFRRELLISSSHEAQIVDDVALFFDMHASQVIKHRMVDEELACDWWYAPVVPCWDALAPLISSRRAMLGYRQWEDFEYLALQCKRFRKHHPLGTYPKGEEALPLPEPWPESAQYVKS